MSPCDGHQREHPEFGWLPPKGQGKNIKQPMADTKGDGAFHYVNGKTTYVNLPADCEEYQVCSMYTCDAAFWLVMYDATLHAVHDGDDSDEGAAPLYTNGSRVVHAAEDSKPDWRKLHFDVVTNAGDTLSYATFNGKSTRLLYQHNDHEWARQLLPHPHLPDHCDDDSGKGGLVGDLSVLLALVGFTMKDEDIVNNASSLVRELLWSLPTRDNAQCPHSGCESLHLRPPHLVEH